MDTSIPLCQHTTKQWWRSLDAMNAGNTARRKVSVFLSWRLKQGYIKEPVHIPGGKPSYPSGDIEVLANNEVSSLIKCCPLDLLGHLWLCLCMGLRVAESSRVEHLKVTETHLVVGAKAAKTKSRRVLDIPQGHERYVNLIRSQVNLRKRMEALRVKAGLSRWPRNCMRHTAASHWLNYYQDEQKAALHLGNSPTMLHRHYKALVKAVLVQLPRQLSALVKSSKSIFRIRALAKQAIQPLILPLRQCRRLLLMRPVKS